MLPSILQYDFMVRALIGGILAGGIAPVLGAFLVLRRYSLIAETLAHVGLLGVAIGLATSTYPTITTFIAVTIAAIFIERLRVSGKLPGDIALAVVLYATMDDAVVIIHSVRGFTLDLWGFLFGSILTISATDVLLLLLLAEVPLVIKFWLLSSPPAPIASVSPSIAEYLEFPKASPASPLDALI